jgi:VanZ family protein
MKYIALLTIAAYFSINALVSAKGEWFGFIYDVPGGDNIAHFVGSGLLAFIMVLGFSSLGTNHRQFGPIASLVAATLLVTLGEIIQIAMPSRDFQLDDLAWSFAGILVFGLAATGLERIRRRLGQSSATFR